MPIADVFLNFPYSVSWLLLVATESGSICLLKTLDNNNGDVSMAESIEKIEGGGRGGGGSLMQVGRVECDIVATSMVLLHHARLLLSGDDGDTKVMRLLHSNTGGVPHAGAEEKGCGWGEWKFEELACMPQLGASSDLAIISTGAEGAGEHLDMVIYIYI